MSSVADSSESSLLEFGIAAETAAFFSPSGLFGIVGVVVAGMCARRCAARGKSL